MNILIIGAHPDDEILGCGGIIHKLESEGHVVKTLVIDKGREDQIDQQFDGLPIKIFITDIEKVVNEFKPEIVFTHYLGDLNRDHQVIAEATQVACRPQSGVKEILSYETPGSAGLSIAPFKPDTYFEITEHELHLKVKDMVEKYGPELRQFPHARSVEGIHYMAQFRGSEINVPLAEAFMTVRRIR